MDSLRRKGARACEVDEELVIRPAMRNVTWNELSEME